MTTQTKPKKIYDLTTQKPVARFYYKGHHTHPVRRTVLLIEERENILVGYEVREGDTVRSIPEALHHVKSYSKDKIAKWGDYSRLRMSSATFLKDPNQSTLERGSIMSMFTEGA